MFVMTGWFIVLSKSSISLLIFCLDVLSIIENRVLNFLTIIIVVELPTWIQTLAGRSSLCHLSCNVSEDILALLLTAHTPVLGSPMQ